MKDSGERMQFDSGFVREPTQDRIRYDLIVSPAYPDTLLNRWATQMTKGATKYSPRNFEKANTIEELERMKQSLWRHFIAYVTDVEDGEDHAAAIMANLQMIECCRFNLRKR